MGRGVCQPIARIQYFHRLGIELVVAECTAFGGWRILPSNFSKVLSLKGYATPEPFELSTAWVLLNSP